MQLYLYIFQAKFLHDLRITRTYFVECQYPGLKSDLYHSSVKKFLLKPSNEKNLKIFVYFRHCSLLGHVQVSVHSLQNCTKLYQNCKTVSIDLVFRVAPNLAQIERSSRFKPNYHIWSSSTPRKCKTKMIKKRKYEKLYPL